MYAVYPERNVHILMHMTSNIFLMELFEHPVFGSEYCPLHSNI